MRLYFPLFVFAGLFISCGGGSSPARDSFETDSTAPADSGVDLSLQDGVDLDLPAMPESMLDGTDETPATDGPFETSDDILLDTTEPEDVPITDHGDSSSSDLMDEDTCIPDCAGRSCGGDGCNGNCGTCQPSAACDDLGICRCPQGITMCDGRCCPGLTGYAVICNAQGHCEHSNSDTTGWKRWDVWVYVPPGTFLMGSPDTEEGHESYEGPVHEVTFERGYLIGKYEVSVLQYEACAAESSACEPASAINYDGEGWGTNSSENERFDHPQNGINYFQAKAVCAWLGGRLPSEAEWEYAASGPAHRVYPWGDTVPTCSYAVYDYDGSGGRPWGCDVCTTSGCSGTSPLGTKPLGTSWSGAMDMAGNVMEWCEDWFHLNYEGAPSDGSAWTEPKASFPVVRGGGFGSATTFLRTASRNNSPEGWMVAGVGVRCARSLEP